MEVPVVKGGLNLPTLDEIGLTDLPNIGGGNTFMYNPEQSRFKWKQKISALKKTNLYSKKCENQENPKKTFSFNKNDVCNSNKTSK
jgi:hypothetical protein